MTWHSNILSLLNPCIESFSSAEHPLSMGKSHFPIWVLRISQSFRSSVLGIGVSIDGLDQNKTISLWKPILIFCLMKGILSTDTNIGTLWLMDTHAYHFLGFSVMVLYCNCWLAALFPMVFLWSVKIFLSKTLYSKFPI